jgi:hypothetical protein
VAYADEVLADSPRGYWKCDEASGTTLADSSGNAITLTCAGTYTVGLSDGPTAGVKSAGFNNSVSDFASGSHSSWTPTEFTVEWWGKPYGPTDFTPGIGNITWAWDGTFMSHGSATGAIYAGSGTTNGSDRLLTGAGAWVANTWAHYVFTITSAKNVVLYKNGSSFASAALASWTFNAWTGVKFGYNGSFCHAAVYPTVLSAARVKAHYQAMILPTKSYLRQKRPVGGALMGNGRG